MSEDVPSVDPNDEADAERMDDGGSDADAERTDIGAETDAETDFDAGLGRAPPDEAPEDLDAFGDLEDAVDDDELEDFFTEVDVEDVDEEDVWAEITDGAADDGTDLETTGEVEAAFEELEADAATADSDAAEAVVEKAGYCRQCPYFSEPPDVTCENEGTEIVELVDTERFRVRNCPVVQRRRGTTEDVLED
jgi:hypothetical protein